MYIMYVIKSRKPFKILLRFSLANAINDYLRLKGVMCV